MLSATTSSAKARSSVPNRDEIARAYTPLPARAQPKNPDMAVLEIELIGNPRQGPVPAGVWHIVGIGKGGDLDRETLRGFRDYSRANGVGSRRVHQTYFLSAGNIYEVKAPQSWKRFDHYFCHIQNSQIIRMNIHQVIAWIKNGWA